MRGEDLFELGKVLGIVETPPRAWGRLFVSGGCRKLLGNTPTCVGKTGECVSTPLFCVETPPRAWGRRAPEKDESGSLGNTPTCVGKTTQAQIAPHPSRKHPHVRGEDLCARYEVSVFIETPPRAWGRRQFPSGNVPTRRNTPTCVGKTLRDYSLFLLSRQNNIETSSFSDTSCSPDNSMSWRFGSPMP